MGARVLVVDDDGDVLDVVRSLLELRGYQVVTAGSGLEALDLVRAGRPDLILLDMRMPVMDGAEFHGRLRSMDGAAAIPVVVMTADAGAADRAEQMRAQGWLQKPVDAFELYHVVGRFAAGACGAGGRA